MDSSLALPAPTDIHDRERVDSLRFQRRLLYGEHGKDVEDAMTAAFGSERALHIKWVDDAANPVPQLYSQLSALYTYPPRIRTSLDEVKKAVERAGHWSAMQRNQRDTLALQDLALILDTGDDGQLQVRSVFPDLWHKPRARTRNPRELAYIGLWLEHGNTWQLHEWQIENEQGEPEPFYRVSEKDAAGSRGEPIKEEAGEAYPHVRAGKPYIPVILYHAADTGRLMDWRSGHHIARGALRIMVMLTGAGHAINDASWIQRVLIDGHFAGVSLDSATPGANSTDVIADPTVVMMVKSDEGKQAMVAAFQSPTDPEAILRCCAVYAQNWAAQAGVRSASMTRTESDIRSGYSLAVSREAVQEQQAIYAPVFRRSDLQLLTTAAWMLGYPEAEPEDFKIGYQALRLSPPEMKSRLEVAERGLDLGLMSRTTAVLSLHPDWDEEQAEEELALIDAESTPPKPAATPAADPAAEPADDPPSAKPEPTA